MDSTNATLTTTSSATKTVRDKKFHQSAIKKDIILKLW